jgi:hypothetical protein
MKETSLEARVTKAGEAIGERVQSATAATAAAAGQAPKDCSGRYRGYRGGGRSGEKSAG